MKKQMKDIKTTIINNDVYGNPRIVVNYTSVFSAEEFAMTCEITGGRYYLAIVKAKNLGAFRKYHNKKYGGGLVIQGSDWRDLPDFFSSSETDCAVARTLILQIENNYDQHEQLLNDARSFLACWGFEALAHNCVKLVKSSIKGRRKESRPTEYQIELAGFHLASKYIGRVRKEGGV